MKARLGLLLFATCFAARIKAAPTATTLNIAATNNQIILSWQGDGFLLQSAPNLKSPVVWSAAGLSLSISGTNYSATTQPSSIAAFYRLISSGAPSGLAVVPEESEFYVNWNLVPGTTNYNLYLATVPGVTPTNYLSLSGGQKISGVNPPYFISGLTDGAKYYAVVTARTTDSESPPSAEASAVFGAHATVSGSIFMNLDTGGGLTNAVMIPGVQVWLVNATNGIATAAVTTDSDGAFSIPAQPAGTYTICYSLSNNFGSCGSICSPQQLVLGSEDLELDPLAYAGSCPVIYGRVMLDGNFAFQDTDPFFGYAVTARVTLVNGFGQTNSAPVNHAGEFVFTGLAPGSCVISVDCEGAHFQQSLVLPPTSPIILPLPNRAPVIQNAYALDLGTGQQIFHAAPGAPVQLVVAAFDPDGDALTYDWISGLGGGSFQSANSASILWQVPSGSGMHTMYFVVRDHKGGFQTGKITLNTDPYILFTGTVVQNGLPPLNGALVTINGQNVSCDPTGYFTLQLANPVPPYVMTIQSQGCELYSKVFWDQAVGGIYDLYQGVEVTFIPNSTSVVTGNGVYIIFLGGSVLDAFNQPYFAPITVTFSAINPADPAGRLPGSLNGTTNGVLLPYAGASVALRAQNGQPLYINPQNPPQISVPLGAVKPPINTLIPVWAYNPATGTYTLTPGFAGTSNTNYLMWPLLQTGVTVAADTAAASAACVTLEIGGTIDLPVNVTVSSPAVQTRTINQRFTKLTDLPPNQLVTFQISQANEMTLTNSCVISNSVTTGASGTNCVSARLDFPGVPKPGDMLSYNFGPGTTNYGNEYYDAIDPGGTKRTFADWKTANGFGAGADAEAIYFNNGDLGFGRWMGMKTNASGDIAYFVSNYGSPDAAITARSGSQTNGLGATVCMEYSKHPNDSTGNARYTKFYIYDEQNQRVSGLELDGRGVKFVPHLCIICHGGITPPEPPGKGDVKSKFLPFDLESFRYSSNPSYTEAAQAAAFKVLNATTLRAATTPTITTLVEGWYGGTGLPGNYNKDFVPPGWTNTPAQQFLYANAFKISCRSCHAARGSSLAFAGFSDLQKRAAGVETTICGPDRTMPNALRTFNIFWSSQCSGVSQPLLLQTNLGFTCP